MQLNKSTLIAAATLTTASSLLACFDLELIGSTSDECPTTTDPSECSQATWIDYYGFIDCNTSLNTWDGDCPPASSNTVGVIGFCEYNSSANECVRGAGFPIVHDTWFVHFGAVCC
jgi:hypothetical protein